MKKPGAGADRETPGGPALVRDNENNVFAIRP